MRKLILLILIAVAIWFGARYFVHRGEIKATIVFTDARDLHKGSDVVENNVVVGKVVSIDKLDDRTAVTVRLGRDHRRAIVSDSLFSIDRGVLDVTNSFAVGAPVADGTVLYAKEDKVTSWVAKHGGALKPYLDKLRASTDAAVDRQFDDWDKKVPQWKSEGKASLDQHIAEARAKVDKAADELTKNNHADEARKLKERFENWVEEIRK